LVHIGQASPRFVGFPPAGGTVEVRNLPASPAIQNRFMLPSAFSPLHETPVRHHLGENGGISSTASTSRRPGSLRANQIALLRSSRRDQARRGRDRLWHT
jgi:hypothetical protein